MNAEERLRENAARLRYGSIDLESPYIVHDNEMVQFHVGQQRVMSLESRYIAVSAGWQSGKGLPLDTPVPTLQGWRPLVDIEAGDTVFGPDGPVAVLEAHPPYWPDDCYEITFCDGSKMICDGDHQWYARSWRQRRNFYRGGKDEWTVVLAREMHERQVGPDGGAEWSIDIVGVEYPDADLPLDPYLLGAWLGDGTSVTAQITTADQEVVQEFESRGFPMVPGPPAGKATTYFIGTKYHDGSRTVRDFTVALRNAGVLRNKHVPDHYRTASRAQRIALVQGLMDTDGYCSKSGAMEFCSCNKELADGFVEVVRSLGIKCRLKTGRAKVGGKDCGPKYRAMFRCAEPMFRIGRKRDRQRPPVRPDVTTRFVRSVEKVPSVMVRCLTVEGELYVAGKQYALTHNTSGGVWWFAREMKRRGPGDYIVIGPSYPLLQKKVAPEYERLFCRHWKIAKNINKSDWMIEFSDAALERFFGTSTSGGCRLFFAHGTSPNSLESGTYKAFHFDEAGADEIPPETHEVLQARVAVHKARGLFTSRPYTFNWYWDDIFNKADYKWTWQVPEPGADPVIHESGQDGGRIAVVNYSSLMNPSFDPEEYWHQKDSMPGWKHAMKYDGLFTRPAGAVYDCFDPQVHLVKPFKVPAEWDFYWGMDFGPVNTACVMMAQDPTTKVCYVYAVYYPQAEGNGAMKVSEHIAKMFKKHRAAVGSSPTPAVFGGAVHEQKSYRDKYTAEGLPVIKPFQKGVENQIQAVYTAFRRNALMVFDDLEGIKSDILGYTYKLDDNGDPTDELKDKKGAHRLDALRYVVSSVLRFEQEVGASVSQRGKKLDDWVTQVARGIGDSRGKRVVLPGRGEDRVERGR